MPGESIQVVVFQDAAGEYYVVPQQVWAQARVPQQHRAEVERLLASGGATSAGKIRDLKVKPTKAAAIKGGATIEQRGTVQVSSSQLNNTGYNWSASG